MHISRRPLLSVTLSSSSLPRRPISSETADLQSHQNSFPLLNMSLPLSLFQSLSTALPEPVTLLNCHREKSCLQSMEKSTAENHYDGEEEEEYVLLDLDNVCTQIDIPPGAPYVLSGLDTLNPILTIGDDLKLVGEYEETIGTCLVFSETEKAPIAHEETGPSETNLFKGAFIIDPNQVPTKQVNPITSLQKIIKFKLLEADALDELKHVDPDSLKHVDPDSPKHVDPDSLKYVDLERPPIRYTYKRKHKKVAVD